MRLRNTLIALVLMVLVGGYALYLSVHQSPAGPHPLYNISAKDISVINLKYPDQVIEIRRNAKGRWVMTQPFATEADQDACEEVADAIANCQIIRTLDKKQTTNLALYGLAKPAAVVTVTMKGGKKLPGVEVGKVTPIGESVYIKTENDPAVMLTAMPFQGSMLKLVSQLRNHQLVSFSMAEAHKFTIEHGGGGAPIEVDKRGNHWWIVKPVKYRADDGEVARWLGTLSTARIEDFDDDSPKDYGYYGLANPELTVTVYTGSNGKQQTVEFGSPQPASQHLVYTRTNQSKSVYGVPDFIFRQLDKSVLDLRNKTVLAFVPSKVTKIEISTPSGERSLSQGADGKWQIASKGSEAGPANGDRVRTFLNSLRSLRGTQIIEDPMTHPKLFGLDHPVETVTLFGENGAKIGSINLGQAIAAPPAGQSEAGPETDYFANSTASTAVYSIDGYGFHQVHRPAGYFKHAPAPKPTPTKVQE